MHVMCGAPYFSPAFLWQLSMRTWAGILCQCRNHELALVESKHHNKHHPPQCHHTAHTWQVISTHLFKIGHCIKQTSQHKQTWLSAILMCGCLWPLRLSYNVLITYRACHTAGLLWGQLPPVHVSSAHFVLLKEPLVISAVKKKASQTRPRFSHLHCLLGRAFTFVDAETQTDTPVIKPLTFVPFLVTLITLMSRMENSAFSQLDRSQ